MAYSAFLNSLENFVRGKIEKSLRDQVARLSSEQIDALVDYELEQIAERLAVQLGNQV